MSLQLLTNRLGDGAGEERPYVRRPWAVISNETQILAALDQPGSIGDTIAMTFARLEHQLAELFGALTLVEARELHRRLTDPVSDDPIAVRFGRMVLDRRQRLLAFLASAPRRAARSGGRR